MSKQMGFNLTHDLLELALGAIREKSDVIKLLLYTIRNINSNIKIEDRQLGKVSINVSKMSRIAYSVNYVDNHYLKSFSFAFPFSIKISDTIEIYSQSSDILIDSTIVNVLIQLVEDNWFDEKSGGELSIYDTLDSLTQTINFFELEDNIESKVWAIAKELFLFEPGYIRYDYDDDPGRLNEYLHPLHHVDLFYSSRATFKLGIDESIITNRIFSTLELLDLIDIHKNCGFINYRK